MRWMGLELPVMSVIGLPAMGAISQPELTVDYEPMERKRGRPRAIPDQVRPGWGERIKEMREARGLTQERLGEAVGKRQTTIGEYESGKTEPDIATFEKLSDVLGAPAWWLAFGQPSDSDSSAYLIALSEEKNRLFAWAVHRVAHMLTEEGLDGDVAFLVALTRKIVTAATKNGGNDSETKKIIVGNIESERVEYRKRLDEIRKGSL